jgi:diketogulonate reductase-like aldo/keto reductase
MILSMSRQSLRNSLPICRLIILTCITPLSAYHEISRPAICYHFDSTDEFIPGTAIPESTWHAMERVVAKVLIKSIGLSNYTGVTSMDLFNYAKIIPDVLQIEHHPYLTQEALVNFFQS